MVASIMLFACGADGRALQAPQTDKGLLPAPGPGATVLAHRLGAFNITTGTQARAAAAAGVSVDFTYGAPPPPRSDLGRHLKELGIAVISGGVPDLLQHYECQRLRADPAQSLEGYCRGVRGGPTTASALLSQVNAYARTSASDPLLAGYWILDDQPDTDFGSLRQVEVEVADILNHYAPSRPTICGVGATLTVGGGYSFSPAKLQDVSAPACDEIGIYVYSQAQPPARIRPSSVYDWSMKPLLSAVHAALQSAGLANLPWVGIGQAWGGTDRIDGRVISRPTIAQMSDQASAFCKAGASMMTWYAWTLSSFSNLRSPANDAHLTDGIEKGGNACEFVWNPTAPPRPRQVPR